MRHLLSALGLLGVLAIPAAAETVVEANVKLLEPGDSIRATRIPDGIYLRSVNDPDDIIWDRVPEYRVHVGPAPAVHPSVALRVNPDDPGHPLYFAVARTGERFYVRLRWRDDSANRETARDAFRDAVAVQFALGDDSTSYMMGAASEIMVYGTAVFIEEE